MQERGINIVYHLKKGSEIAFQASVSFLFGFEINVGICSY